MRPLELTLEGFKSYRQSQSFNFESRSLFGIVGPTGAGKSSILEALIFALYGKTPRVERDTKKLINSHEDQARVHLIFEADGVAWEVMRFIRRKGASQTVLRRLGDNTDPVTGDRNANERIAEVVGLDFDAFCASVSLPQGEFDRFLKATPSERSRILKGIFRLERVDQLREAARGREGLIRGQLLTLQAALDLMPDDPATLLQALKEESAAAAARVGQLNEALPATLKAEQDIERSAQLIGDIEEKRSQVLAALAKLPRDEALRDLADRQDAAEQRYRDADRALEEATEALRRAEEESASVEAMTGGEAWFSAVETAMAARGRLSKLIETSEVESARLERSLQDLLSSCTHKRQELETAQAAALAAGRDLENLKQRHSAHLLRSELVPGEPCPVCEQTVAKLPSSAAVPALETANERARHAEAALEDVRLNLDAAERERGLAQERHRLTLETLGRTRSELDELNGTLLALAGAEGSPVAELSRRRELLTRVKTQAKSARASRDAAEAGERRARKELADLSAGIMSLTNILSHTCGILGMGSVSMEEEGLWGAAKRVSEAASVAVSGLVSQAEALKEGVLFARRTIEEFRTRFGAEAGEGVSDVVARAKGEVTRLAARIQETEAAIVRRLEIEEQMAVLNKDKALYERLVADFADSKFTAYLLDEQRRLLSRLGSEKFLELTGHFTFDDEGKFQVIDQRTGVTRTTDTLSGGETFLASLSLALALAEAVALEGGRLGFFFLDEGFGSLDSESLDLAMKGIEALATPGRLIGLISHVVGIQAWLDDLIVLERAADGSTEVVQHEGPIGYGAAII